MSILIKGMEMPSEQYGKMEITLYPNGHVAEYVGDIGRVWEAISVPSSVYARPVARGKWLHKKITDDFHVVGQCSVCKERRRIDNFCPNCGADMRKKDND